MHFTVTAEVDASHLFENESADWRYCIAFATFSHDEACEFIIHCGNDEDAEYAAGKARDMKAEGCSDAFIDAYELAARSGAVRVIFYA